MALTIRLRQQGRANRQTFRLVVADSRSPRDGKYVETLGWYIPFQEKDNISLNQERIEYWLSVGALPSDMAENLLSQVAPDVLKRYKTKNLAKKGKRTAQRRERSKASA